MDVDHQLCDDVAARLSSLDVLPVEEHVAVYDQIHRQLRDQLVDGPAADGLGDPARPSSADTPQRPS